MKSVKAVTYGAMSVGLISLLFFLDRLFVGNLGFMMSIVIPIPLVLYGYKFSLKEGVAVYITMIIASVIFNGMPPAIVSMTGFGLIGLIYIHAYEQEYSVLKKNVLLFICMGIVYLIMMQLFAAYFGLSIQDTVETVNKIAPYLSSIIVYGIVVLSTVATIMMEIYILNTTLRLLEWRLGKYLKK